MIGDRYTLSGLHASGSQSKVWKALDRISGANRIVKTGSQVKKEALLARSLSHPYIAFPYDFGIDPELGEYAVYPEFNGPNSLQWVTQNGDKERLKLFAAQVAEFLCFLHHRGWLYNDFKPEHFLIEENKLKVIDLGLCTESNNGHSTTFSGTFPYISPERLNGRPYDQRSDIFAFGVLLLHLLSSDQSIPLEPSQAALQSFLLNANRLKEPWRSLILQMTALEPAQRIGNANEVLRKISPGAEKNSSYGTRSDQALYLPEGPFDSLLCIQASSERSLDRIYNEIVLKSWQNNLAIYAFDFKSTTPDDAFQNLSVALTGKRMCDRYAGFRIFAERQGGQEVVVVFRMPERLKSEQRALFFFGLSCLADYDWLKIVLLTSKSWSSYLGDSWKYLVAPASTEDGSESSLEALPPSAKKVLNALAVSGGNLANSVLDEIVDKKDLIQLQRQGFVLTKNGSTSLLLTADFVLKRMRSGQKASTASRILQTTIAKDPITLFHLGVNSGDERLAARAALRQARKLIHSDRTDSSKEWLWKAFAFQAKLPHKTLFLLLKHYLRAGDLSKARKLIRHIHARFGNSFRLGDLRLDYFHRKHKLKPPIRIANEYILAAKAKGLENVEQYFRIRQAGFHVLNHDFEIAQNILKQIPESGPEPVQGLRYHFSGLLHFFHGNLTDSLKETKIACKLRHRFRSSSIMNVGVALGKMGRYEQSENWLQRSIVLFSKVQDQDRLSHAFNNLGLVYLGSGKAELGKKNFSRSYHLSRACRNPKNYISAISNLGLVHEREGQTDKALVLRSQAYRLARKFDFRPQQSYALVYAGLHFAYKGRFRKAVNLLKEAIAIRTELKLPIALGQAYEHLAVTYLLAKRFKVAENTFLKAGQLFRKAGCEIDPLRIDIWLAIVAAESRDFVGMRIFNAQAFPKFQPNSLEDGLLCYARALYLFRNPADKNCLAAIHDAERVFRRVPALFWLAKIQMLKADFYRHNENYEKSILSLQTAYHLFTRLGARKELQNLPKEGMDMQVYQDFLERLAHRLPYKALQMVKEILSVQQVDAMVTKILETALELTSMDRAMLILNEEPLRIFKSASLDDSNVQDALDVSRSVLKSATESGKSVVCFDASADPLLQDRPSIINNRILSVVCLPLRGATGQAVGCLYLDSCEGVETLAETERILLEIFSSIVGLALSQSLLLEKSVSENRELRNWLELRKDGPDLIGNSPAIQQVLRTALSVVDHALPILITGETGTGKELVARVLHYSSKRKNGPFVAVNCAAFSRELLESELFGHEKGSFTGAMLQKKGVFEQAQDGTLFLDEIGEMPLEMQAKLLRVLQGGEFRRIGGTQTLSTNARIIFATNRNLEEMVKLNTFREDLFYRIKVVEIGIPPLRERPADIPLLATAFLNQIMAGSGKRFVGFTHDGLELMKHYSWPGNVRQLKSEIERIVALNDHEWIDVDDFDPRIVRLVQTTPETKVATAGSLSEIEKKVIIERLIEHKGNVVLAARSLGITRHGLYSKMKRYQISNSKN